VTTTSTSNYKQILRIIAHVIANPTYHRNFAPQHSKKMVALRICNTFIMGNTLPTRYLQPFLLQQPFIQTNIKMATERLNRRRVCRKALISNPSFPTVSQAPKTVLDSPRWTRLLTNTRATAGKLPCIQLFNIHNVAN
jgi:hypothetical protein